MKKVFVTFLVFVFSISVFAQNAETKKLYALFDAEWERGLENSPISASYQRDNRANDKWDDISLTAIEKRFQETKVAYEKIKKIDRSKLSKQDKLNYDLFKKNYEQSIEGYKFRRFLFPMNQRGGIQTGHQITRALSFATVKDYEDWIARLNAFPVYMDQTIALMKEGIRVKHLGTREVLSRIPSQIDFQIVTDYRTSPWYAPFKKFPASFSEADKKRLSSAGVKAVGDKIVPAYKKLKKFFVDEYLPASFEKAGIWQIPNGREYYAFSARSFTTTDMTPDEIHEKGLSEVARIRSEMEAIRMKVGFKGNLKEFFDHLRTDPKYFYKTPQELLDAYRAISKKIDPEVPKVIKTMPRMPYGVIPIPDEIAPDTTTAYYNRPAPDGTRAGYYYVNLYKPETRPKWEMMALSIHEAVPGHHLQIALQQELGEVPNFRKFGGFTAFVEGWALYSESLGEEMGLYEDPLDKFGQLTYEMWRAVRLVVDTGMHHKEWSRQRAIDYFAENAPKTMNDIENEIDRYISWPGQALAYKIGELKIKELRAKATRELGDKFDLREFHDVVLLSGAIPLDLLENNVDQWIAEIKKK